MSQTKITGHEVEQVAEKLEKFAKGLSQQEQDVLGWVLTRAQTAPEPKAAAAAAQAQHDVKAHTGYKTAIASELARAVGLTVAQGPQVTVVVGWTYRFGREFGGNIGDPALHGRGGPSGGGSAG